MKKLVNETVSGHLHALGIILSSIESDCVRREAVPSLREHCITNIGRAIKELNEARERDIAAMQGQMTEMMEDSGEPKTAAPALYFHVNFPLLIFKQCTYPSAEPKTTLFLEIAGEENIAPPALYFQFGILFVHTVIQITSPFWFPKIILSPVTLGWK